MVDRAGDADGVAGIGRGVRVAGQDRAADAEIAVEMAEDLGQSIPFQPGVCNRHRRVGIDGDVRRIDQSTAADIGV